MCGTHQRWCLFWKNILNKQLLKPGQVLLYSSYSCTRNRKENLYSSWLYCSVRACLQKTLLNPFRTSIFVGLTSTTKNTCVLIHFLLSDRFTPQQYFNMCTLCWMKVSRPLYSKNFTRLLSRTMFPWNYDAHKQTKRNCHRSEIKLCKKWMAKESNAKESTAFRKK